MGDITASSCSPNKPKNKKTSEKDDGDFRTYDVTTTSDRVIEHYRAMRANQTLAFHAKMSDKYKFDPVTGAGRRLMTMEDAFDQLESYVDSSDPDLDLPNRVHLLQTAEGIRRAGQPDWMQVVGLIHDMGKIMFLWGEDEDGQNGVDPDGHQWALGGDTWILGCEIPESVVFPQFNALNVDMQDEICKSKYGIYSPNCGLNALKCAWGHDEYMYRMLIANKCTIPPEGLAIIRYHSLYPWHSNNAYSHLTNNQDEETKGWVQFFNAFDLYTKDEENELHVESLWNYYYPLLEKYGLGGQLWW